MRRSTMVALMVLLAACGDDRGGTLVGPNGYPNVAGIYTGSVTMTAFSLNPNPLEGTARFTVVQSGADVTISGTFDFPVFQAPIPIAATGTINTTGYFTVTASGRRAPADDPTCGRFHTRSQSLTFSGRTLLYERSADTDHCGLFTAIARLRR